ncbi:hypothetical protein ACUXOE_001833 [Staphylococcus cohnii]
MVKIKQKKQLNLLQLIEWLLKSGYRNYTANSNMGNIVTLSRYGAIQFSHGTFFPEETFTVEVEEEITEDTVLDELVELYEDYLENNEILKHKNRSISEAKDEDRCASQAFYIIHDDLTMTLIWTREKGLVE